MGISLSLRHTGEISDRRSITPHRLNPDGRSGCHKDVSLLRCIPEGRADTMDRRVGMVEDIIRDDVESILVNEIEFQTYAAS